MEYVQATVRELCFDVDSPLMDDLFLQLHGRGDAEPLMSNHENRRNSLLQHLIDRVGNPLEWRYVDKTLLLLGFVIVMSV